MQIMYQNDGISKRKLIETITTSTFYLKYKDNNENDMAAHVFWAVFCFSQQPSQIGPTAENDSPAIPPPIFFMLLLVLYQEMTVLFLIFLGKADIGNT